MIPTLLALVETVVGLWLSCCKISCVQPTNLVGLQLKFPSIGLSSSDLAAPGLVMVPWQAKPARGYCRGGTLPWSS